MSGLGSSKQAKKARDLKHRVLVCLYKLSDRDTHSAAASELESIARTINGDSIPFFISSIVATDSSDKSPVRRQCLRLICVLSEQHGNSLSPYLSKLLSAVVRRLRDANSSVRAACVTASLALSSHITSSSFTTISKPFLESLFVEQDSNTQSGAALCLAAIIEGSKSPDAASLRRLLPKLEKLAKSESFKAKAALLTLIRTIVEVKGVLIDGAKNVVRNLIVLLVGFLISEDWAARKAAAEALMKIAAMERHSLSEYKIPCLKKFEAKRFDKVKATREMMNQMIEAWKEIPDLPDDKASSPLPELEASHEENCSESHNQPDSKAFSSVGSATLRAKMRSLVDNTAARKLFANGSPASISRSRSSRYHENNKKARAMFQKLDNKKPVDLKVEVVTPSSSCGVLVCDDNPSNKDDDNVEQTRKPEIKCDNNGNLNLGLFRGSSSRLPLCSDASVIDCEELSQIREQLLQIENQQSNLFDLLQRFIGSSQNSMHSLEARVHGLELALDDISFDLGVSTGRLSPNVASGSLCCRLLDTEFLSSKLWRKSESLSTPRPSAAAISGLHYKNGAGHENHRRHGLQGSRGSILNPLAKVSGHPFGSPEVSSSAIATTITI
ncbi:TORTIFOLIA1-like protein 4 [Andrographis paniculata]|uniref:TORTIFOLIA1-like protein 4 n=1 Tax=Andrographis paniculata TaxID=175694 RepID=UPI0021E8DEA7|nr:TORTIFOLIA1-like protein 4 [Andrographis paniculata]